MHMNTFINKFNGLIGRLALLGQKFYPLRQTNDLANFSKHVPIQIYARHVLVICRADHQS